MSEDELTPVNRQELQDKSATYVGVGWGPHPIFGDDGFIHPVLLVTDDQWVLGITQGIGPIDLAHLRSLLGTTVPAELIAPFAVRGGFLKDIPLKKIKDMLARDIVGASWEWAENLED